MIAVFMLMTASAGFSQQPTLISHYMFTNMALNPAVAGTGSGICVTGLVRQQLMGWKDPDGTKSGPETFMLTADMPIRFLHGGIGTSIYQDKIGFQKNITLELAYSYHTDLWNGDLALGLQGNLFNLSFDGKFDPIDDGDPVISGMDGKTSSMSVDAGLGLFYRVPDSYYIGLSADNILQTTSKKLGFQNKRTFYAAGGYDLMIPRYPAFEIQPSALIMFDGAVYQINASAVVTYNKKVYGGLGYRFQDAVTVLAGMYIKGLHVGVAYDINTSPLAKYNNGALEVMVNYCFKIDLDKYRKSYRNTRFL
jgi:type IX secretion system PorP/SprF family membrane protein